MKNLGLLSLVILFLGLAGCESTWESRVDYEPTVKFIMNNKSDHNANTGEDVHLWITEETIGPENKVHVGERRETVYVLKNTAAEENQETELEDVTVYAGRNGIVLTSLTTSVSNKSILARFDWDGTSLSQY